MKEIAIILFIFHSACFGKVKTGVDVFFEREAPNSWKGKKIGLVTNHTGRNKDLVSDFDLFFRNDKGFVLAAVFSPEHGFWGTVSAEKSVDHEKQNGIPIYSLYGNTRRPTEEMLRNIDVLIYDIQDIGVRSYSYATTLYYVMEEAAKRNIPVIVLDRPNPLGGTVIDGPGLEEKFRSFIGYIDVPYCHGMTIGELALYFNTEYRIGCRLEVVAMQGWSRKMTFADTGLVWIPTSPYIPEPDTPLFYAATGLIGELGLLSIGIGYTLPFKVVGAPWIEEDRLAGKLTEMGFPGVAFLPFRFVPTYGLYKGELCKGILLRITDPSLFSPVKLQHGILGIVKSLYPKQVNGKIDSLPSSRKELFCKAEGSEIFLSLLRKESYPAWKMIEAGCSKNTGFVRKRKPYLLYN